MKGYAIVAGTIAMVVVIALFTIDARTARAPSGGQFCTADVKECQDGSYVSRSGPSCAFAVCPEFASPITLETGLGEEIGGHGVTISPLEILEDSRCPVDVQCIQAGTVRIKARLTSGLGVAMQEFTLHQPITTETEIVTLTGVAPSTHSKKKIYDSQYVFTFTIAKR